jgi:8-oxo-dGTP diphosphatase
MDESPRLLVVAALVWLDDTHLLVQRRPARARFGAGLLELPGGKVERGEAPASALARELVEEWGPRAEQLQVGAIVELLHHVYPPPGPEVVLAVYDVDGRAWAHAWAEHIALEDGAVACAFAAHDLPVDEFLPADRDFVASVRAGRRRP